MLLMVGVSAFFYTDMDRYIEELDNFINRQVFLALRKFGWKLTGSSIGKLPSKYKHRKESSDCLSATQRIKSGIPLCKKMLLGKRQEEVNNIS